MKLICTAIIIILCVTSEVKSQDISEIIGNMSVNAENMTALEKWQRMEITLKNVTGAFVKKVMPFVLKATENMNISSQCKDEATKLLLGIKDIKPWAFRFIDSSAKIMDGLIAGSMSSLGVYDECLNTVVKQDKGKDKETVLFKGQYCIINIKPPLPPKAKYYWFGEYIPDLKNLTLSGTVISVLSKHASRFYPQSAKWGVCVPSGCTVEDMDQVVKMIGNHLLLDAKTSSCEVKEPLHFTSAHICIALIYGFFIFMAFIGSFIEVYSQIRGVVFKSTLAQVFSSFSFISNFKKFANTDSTSDNLSCLHGVRFLCMSWIILSHTYFLLNTQAVYNAEEGVANVMTFAFQVVMNGSVSVDTFFCMGGLLVCYLAVKTIKMEGKKFNVLLYIVHRLCRIYPAYIMIILLAFMNHRMISGPLSLDLVYPYVDSCYDNWWTNLLFINNLYNAEKTCLTHSWYIATDFQLYILALLILLPILRWPKRGISLAILVVFTSVVFTGVQTYLHKLTPTMFFLQFDPGEMIHSWKVLYFTPLPHAGPYFIGIIAGYLLITRPNLKMPVIAQILGWIAAFICCFSSVYGAYNWNNGKEINFTLGIMYASLFRSVWALGVAWMIVSCATGHGGIINYILSLKIFIPLSRLTFLAYLIHPFMQMIFMASLRQNFALDHVFIVWIFFGNLCTSYAVAFAGTMLVEVPMLQLEKMIFKRDAKKAKDPSSIRSDSFMNGTLMTKKNGDIVLAVDKDSDKSLGIDKEALSKL